MTGEFVGGALSFKGDKKKKQQKKKKQKVKHELEGKREAQAAQLDNDLNESTPRNRDDDLANLTEVERKALKRRLERERIDAEKAAQKSHRERIEEFNAKLASLTELNDIPRVSAAGNG
jgi:protein FAM32A